MDLDYVVMPAIVLAVGILIVWLGVRRMLSLSKKGYRTWRKIAERVVLSAVVLVAAAVAASSSFNAIALYRFRALNPPPGTFYAVNGHRMHLNCTGSGSPTIVLEAGLGNDALIWGGVQPVLARTTRVCAYDRAGFGWSDALPAPRDADHIADELRQLLLQAKISGPIVLMGHSIAGIYMRDYATRYPADLAGIVFVDGSTPMQQENPAFKAMSAKGPPQWAAMLLMRSALIAGVPRLIGMCSQSQPGFEAHAAKLQAEDTCHAQIEASSAEMDSLNQSGLQTAHTGPYGDLPILIFSHDPAKSLPKQNPPQQSVAVENAWSQMQEDLKKLSRRSRRIVAKDSTHYVQIDRAELIEKEVPLFIEQIRGTVPQPANYGSTIVE
jgi:pimeloyl-ACP methyl ester carboxylesterase